MTVPAARRLLEIEIPITLAAAESLVMAAGLARDRAEALALVTATVAAGPPLLETASLARTAFIVGRGDAPAAASVIAWAVRLADHRGLARMSDVDDALARASNARTPQFHLRVLTGHPAFQWLHRRTGWFWFRERPNPLLERLRKIFAVVTAAPLAGMHRALFSSWPLDRVPPFIVLRRVCQAGLVGATIAGGRVRVPGLLDRTIHLSRDDEALLRALGGSWRFLSLRDVAARLGVEFEDDYVALAARLSASPLVELGGGGYRLLTRPGEVR